MKTPLIIGVVALLNTFSTYSLAEETAGQGILVFGGSVVESTCDLHNHQLRCDVPANATNIKVTADEPTSRSTSPSTTRQSLRTSPITKLEYQQLNNNRYVLVSYL
ncbi:hypothetical protein [Salinivibrio kushneri]|uniref:hypothetical protein n=1 Tax=Salinivibrio kushneri TaxID=1908198 RepID=UPI000C816C16|nr:hypothetical protein [Salinivibrio kushneri]